MRTHNEYSSWVHYPEQYKFFSIHIQLNEDVKHVTRNTYDATNFARDLGGVFFVGLRVFGAAAYVFSNLRLQTLITNRLFYVSQQNKSNLLTKCIKDNKIPNNSHHEIRLTFPKFIDLQYLRFALCRCCCTARNQKFALFRTLVEQGAQDFEGDLDIVRLVRRMRSYGIALYYLTSRKERDLISRMAAFKPLRQ